MSVPSDLHVGYVRRALQEFLAFVPEPPPLPGPGEDTLTARNAWCQQHRAKDTAELGRRWTERLDALGSALFRAGMADRIREGRPALEPPLPLMIDRALEQAHALLRIAADKAEGGHRWRQIRARLRLGRNVSDEERERAAQLEVGVLDYSDILTNLLYADGDTFRIFTAAIRQCVGQVLGTPSPDPTFPPTSPDGSPASPSNEYRPMTSSELYALQDWTPISGNRLPKIILAVESWRTALTQHNGQAWDARNLFLTLTMSLQNGRFFEGQDQIPLGRPRLEEALHHLRQLAHRGNATDTETSDALNDVLREVTAVAAGAKPNRASGSKYRSDKGEPSARANKEELTVKEAATISGISRGQISRLANDGSLKSNGKTGNQRRINSADLNRFLLERAQKPEQAESDEAVLRKLRKAQQRRN
jgi:excisionase family DNA binding protein